MNKPIYARVRAALEKAERDVKRAAEAKARHVTNAQISAAARREARIDGIIEGRIMPRNAEEDEIQFRALYGDCGPE